jgi:hypothetical protein
MKKKSEREQSPQRRSSLRSTIENRPELRSLDSGGECSLDHWLEVYWLVEEEYAFAQSADAEIRVVPYNDAKTIG